MSNRANKSFFSSIYNLIIFSASIFCTAPIIAIYLGGRTVSLYTISIVGILFFGSLRIVSNRIILRVEETAKSLFAWLIASSVSCVFGMLYYMKKDEWFTNSQSYLIKTGIYIVIAIIIIANDTDSNTIFSGLLYGAIANLIWVIIDVGTFYVMHYSLTNRLFVRYIQTNQLLYGSIDVHEGSLLRSGGFNTDPASIGLFAPLVLAYGVLKDNKYLVLISIIATLFSGSTTAIACCVCAYIFAIFCKKKDVKFKRLNSKKKVIAFAIFIVVVIVLIRYMPLIQSRFAHIYARVTAVYGLKSSSTNVRIEYIKELPIAISKQNIKLITGTGFGSSSEGFLGLKASGIVFQGIVDKPYDMENLYMAYFFDNGIIGFGIFLSMLTRLYHKAKKSVRKLNCVSNSEVAYAGMLGILFSCVFYHYTLYSFHILLFLGICQMKVSEELIEEPGGTI